MKFERSCGILLHPTSLPSPYGIGDLGEEAYAFIDFLRNSNQKLWQILPLNPVGYGESPYQCFSAFAGNTLLVSIDRLRERGLLTEEEIMPPKIFDKAKVNFDIVKKYKEEVFKKAFYRFKALPKEEEYECFLQENGHWLDDFALFMALKTHFGGTAWNHWDFDIAFRKKEAIQRYREKLNNEIEYQIFLQYEFFSQWMALKKYANENGVKIIGDLPIFVSYDSSDTWVQPHLFELDERGNPAKVAGVPPDFFSETGQLWGNPHFKWREMERDGFKWWIRRFEVLLKMVDIIRVDHFRGFEAYWEIPGGEKNAVKGQWVKAPGEKLFTLIKEQFKELPVIVEDLGFITPEVEALKNKFGFPGMKILQFAFGDAKKGDALPKYYEENCVLYTGTHDNETLLGWYKNLLINAPKMIQHIQTYLNIKLEEEPEEVCWDLIEIVYGSNANLVIIPLQDVLSVDNRGRMNFPGTIGGNWAWRYAKEDLTQNIKERLNRLAEKYNR